MRLIDADALIGALHNVTFEDGTDREIVYRCVELAPTIEERKTGKWIETGYVDGINVRDGKCSACGEWIDVKRKSVDGGLLYCPFCGAKMEVDDEAE